MESSFEPTSNRQLKLSRKMGRLAAEALTLSTFATRAGVKAVKKLSYKDERRLSEAEALVPKLESDIAQLEVVLSDANLYTRDSALFHKTSTLAATLRAQLAKAEEAWLELSELKESLTNAA